MSSLHTEGTENMRRSTIYTAGSGDADGRTPKAQRFAAKLNSYLLQRGWRQTRLAKEAEQHLPPGHKFGRHLISSYCRGVHMPTQLHLEAMAKALGIKLNDLVVEGEAVVIGQRADTVAIESEGADMARVRVDMILPMDVGLEVIRLVRSVKR